MTPEAELFLFSAGRSLLLESEILPALKRGDIFLSDGCFYATCAYQGYGRGIGLQAIDLVNNVAMRGTRPDLGIIIDINPEMGLQKATTAEFGKKNRFEQENLDFHKRVRQGYLEIARRENNVHVVPYILNGIEEMQAQIRGIVDKFLSENFVEK